MLVITGLITFLVASLDLVSRVTTNTRNYDNYMEFVKSEDLRFRDLQGFLKDFWLWLQDL